MESTCQWILESGPWHVMNRPVVIRKWEYGVTKLDLDLSKFPVSVKLSNVPLKLQTRKGLSFIASGLGIPLYMDRATALKQKLHSAKVYVEIDFKDEIPDFLEVELKDGSLAKIGVEVPWKPPRCSKCKTFGHQDCSQKVVTKQVAEKQWIPKNTKVDEFVREKTPSLPPVESSVELLIEQHIMQSSEDFPPLTAEKAKETKKGKMVATGSTTSKASSNRFSILENVETIAIAGEKIVDIPVEQSSPKRTRAASARVAEVMKQVIPKKRSTPQNAPSYKRTIAVHA
ncbi:hypothetical protein COLO4_34246 [Corchorus olitorius]|uniref:Uncharacterized protein n=1 Tax=Corchorus olitorius TaxID=93759 RepID=A0A1R3GMQ5_9ROSI|nr:hypothetical protein COLO4_34246 [Corchorus olitorius]